MESSMHLEARRGGFKLKLWSGLNATLYRLDNPLVRKIAEACAKVSSERYEIHSSRRCLFHVLVFEVEDEQVAIVYLVGLIKENMLKTAEKRQTDIFDCPHLMVYNGIGHYHDHAASILEHAITRKIKPSLSALLSDLPDLAK